MKHILIIANARRKGGLSGGDNIYLNFAKYWKGRIDIWDMINIDFKPFWLCYIYRITVSIIYALKVNWQCDTVYSASDFLMDSIPAWIISRRRKCKWVAGFYLYAPKNNTPYRLSQFVAYHLIKWKADVVCITNSSMKWGFKDKKTVEVNGGVDLKKARFGGEDKIYDAVFCGRNHPTKGIEELKLIWINVIKENPKAKLAIITDSNIRNTFINATVFYCMDDERFDIYKKSKVVLYPTPIEHDHFSMAPVEAMACGCPLVAFRLPVMKHINPGGAVFADSIEDFAFNIKYLTDNIDGALYRGLSQTAYDWARKWDWEARAKQVYGEIKGMI